ncbi:hypothetical protein LTR93_011130 [Exophiala xenobiotica]|nr:hypothetical protein LTR93_011130 [Exophiala xenobiotica]
MVEESLAQVLNRFPGLTAGGQPQDPTVPGPSVKITPSESDGQTQGSGSGRMHLDGTPLDVNSSSSFAGPATSTRIVHISNIQDARGRIERILDYKGERKNDAGAIWLRSADNTIAEQEELTQSRFTDRQKIAHASRALEGEADAWYHVNQRQARRSGDYWFAKTWTQFQMFVADRFKHVRTNDEHRDEFDSLRQDKTVQVFYPTIQYKPMYLRNAPTDDDCLLLLKRGLKSNIRDRIEILPDTPNPSEGRGRAHTRPSPYRKKDAGGDTQLNSIRSASTLAVALVDTSEDQQTFLGLVRTKPLKSDQQLCYNCGKPGHIQPGNVLTPFKRTRLVAHEDPLRETSASIDNGASDEEVEQSVDLKASSADDAEPLEAFPLRQDPLDVHLAAHESIDGAGKKDSYNLVNGTLNWPKEPVSVTILLDTGSEASYISKRAFQRLPKGLKVRTVRLLRVRLTNGQTTPSTRVVATGLTLGNFLARGELRILEWDAYDVILGLDWLKQHDACWDIASNRVTVKNGAGKESFIFPIPFRTINYEGIEDSGLNLISFRKAHKTLSKMRKRKFVASIPAEPLVTDLSDLSTAPKLRGHAQALARYTGEKGEPPPKRPRPPAVDEAMTPTLYCQAEHRG